MASPVEHTTEEARLQLHEAAQHGPLEERIAALMGTVEAACQQADELAAAHTEHLASYHAPEGSAFDLEQHAAWTALHDRLGSIERRLDDIAAGHVEAAPAVVEETAQAAADAAVAATEETAGTAAEPAEIVIPEPEPPRKERSERRRLVARLRSRR